MKVAVIGCGYVGSACAGHMRRLGHHVTATTTTPERLPEVESVSHKAVLLNGNDLKGMTALVKEQDAVIITVAPTHGRDYNDTYLCTMETLVKALKRAPTPQQVIYTSSASVYGDNGGQLLNESEPLAPLSPNSIILCLTENVLTSAIPEGIDVCILRLGEIYGPGRELVAHVHRSHQQPLPGNGHNITNLIHRDDVVGAIAFAVDHNLSGIYNLCNNVHIPRRDLYEELCHRHALEAPQWDASRPSTHGGNRRVCNQKIQNAGYQIKTHSY